MHIYIHIMCIHIYIYIYVLVLHILYIYIYTYIWDCFSLLIRDVDNNSLDLPQLLSDAPPSPNCYQMPSLSSGGFKMHDVCIYLYFIFILIYLYAYTYILIYTHISHIYFRRLRRAFLGCQKLARINNLSMYLSLSLYIYIYIYLLVNYENLVQKKVTPLVPEASTSQTYDA